MRGQGPVSPSLSACCAPRLRPAPDPRAGPGGSRGPQPAGVCLPLERQTAAEPCLPALAFLKRALSGDTSCEPSVRGQGVEGAARGLGAGRGVFLAEILCKHPAPGSACSQPSRQEAAGRLPCPRCSRPRMWGPPGSQEPRLGEKRHGSPSLTRTPASASLSSPAKWAPLGWQNPRGLHPNLGHAECRGVGWGGAPLPRPWGRRGGPAAKVRSPTVASEVGRPRWCRGRIEGPRTCQAQRSSP